MSHTDRIKTTELPSIPKLFAVWLFAFVTTAVFTVVQDVLSQQQVQLLSEPES